MAFVTDSFTGTSGTTLASHTGETGATWTKHPTYTAGAAQIGTNRLRVTTATAVYYASGSPASAEYDVQADMYTGVWNTPASANCSLLARINTGADTWYAVGIQHSDGNLVLSKRVAGTNTILGTYNVGTQTNGTSITVRFEVRDATKKVYVNGVERISSTDNAITAAGKAGVRMGLLSGSSTDSNGAQFDNFSASDPVAPPGAGTLGAGTVDRFGRVTMAYTAGTGSPTSLRVYRSNDGTTFADVTTTCTTTDNGSGSWTVVDRRPHYSTEAVTYGGTGYYKVVGVNLGGNGADSNTVTVAAIDVDVDAAEASRAAVCSTYIGAQPGDIVPSDTAGSAYPGYWVMGMAYAYQRFGVAQYKTDALNQFAYITGSCVTADGLILLPADSTGIYRDFHTRTIVHCAIAARLLRRAGAGSDAQSIIDQCDVWAKAFFDNLNSGNPAPDRTFSGWDANDTTLTGNQQPWAAATTHALGEVRKPTVDNSRIYRATTAGATHATTEPTWPTTAGGTVTDGTVAWTETTKTVACSYSTYSTSAGHAPVGGQASDLNQNMEEALAFALLVTDSTSDFYTAGTYRTKAEDHIADTVDLVLCHETSTGAITIGQASGETASATTSDHWYDTLYGNYVLHMAASVQTLLPTLNAYLPGFISRGFDYALGYYGTEPISAVRYTVADPGVTSSVIFHDPQFLDAVAHVSGTTYPLSHLVWTAAFQVPASDKVGDPYSPTGSPVAYRDEQQVVIFSEPAVRVAVLDPIPTVKYPNPSRRAIRGLVLR